MQSTIGTRRRAGQATPAPFVEIARLDRDGTIVSVNGEWNLFCVANGGDPDRCGPGRSYLEICDSAGDPASTSVGAAICSALDGDLLTPRSLSLACDSPAEARWYDLAVYPRFDDWGSVLGAAVALWRSGGPASEPVPDDGVLPLLKEASRAIDALWRSATGDQAGGPPDRAAPSAIQLGEASQGVHRALIALAGMSYDGPGPEGPTPVGVVLTASVVDEAIQRLSRASLELHHAARRIPAGQGADHWGAAVVELDLVIQDLRRMAFAGSGPHVKK